MKKRLHLLMATLLIACVASAQEFGIGGPLRLQPIPLEPRISTSTMLIPGFRWGGLTGFSCYYLSIFIFLMLE